MKTIPAQKEKPDFTKLKQKMNQHQNNHHHINHDSKRQVKKSLVIIELFKEICKNQKYWNQWRTSEHWIELINAVYPESLIFNFQKRDLNDAVSKDAQLKHCEVIFCSMSNSYGIYM